MPGVAELHGVHEERHRGDLGNIFQLVLRGYNDHGHTDTHTHQSSSDSNICFSYFSGIRIDMSFVPEPFDSTGNATT